jgi:hypothetical protein
MKWGSMVILRGNNPEPPMSALGQKQTSRLVEGMSALPPKADIRRHDQHVRFVPKANIASLNWPRCLCDYSFKDV